jgi:hypothetical protein
VNAQTCAAAVVSHEDYFANAQRFLRLTEAELKRLADMDSDNLTG